jgi:hypothetical protein
VNHTLGFTPLSHDPAGCLGFEWRLGLIGHELVQMLADVPGDERLERFRSVDGVEFAVQSFEGRVFVRRAIRPGLPQRCDGLLHDCRALPGADQAVAFERQTGVLLGFS